MRVFELLDEDHRRIDEQLTELTNHYDEWPLEKIFDESGRIFDELKRDFERQQMILSVLREKETARPLVEKCLADRKQIRDEIDGLLMSHVDDKDYNQRLRALLAEVHSHIKLTHETLYSKAQDFLTPAELQVLDSKLEDAILR